MGAVVTIPFEFGDLPEESRKSIVPICIRKNDDDGNEIADGWFDAVVPIQDPLRGLAKRRLGDVWRVSELAEISVHKLWRRHRTDFGHAPHRRVYKQAAYDVEDLRTEGYRNRRGRNISLDDLGSLVQEFLLKDTKNFEAAYQDRLRLDEVHDWLKEHDGNDIREMLDRIARGERWSEIAESFEEPKGAVRRRFSRWMARIRDAI